MATPARSLILADLITILRTITIANGFKTDVRVVDGFALSRDDVSKVERPRIGVVAGRESYEMQPSDTVRTTLTVRLACVITASSQVARSDVFSDLIDDIWAAVGVDITRNGNAIDTRLVDSETDESDPDHENDGEMVVSLQIIYFRTQGAT